MIIQDIIPKNKLKKELKNFDLTFLVNESNIDDTSNIFPVFSSYEFFPIEKINALYAYLSDLHLESQENKKINRDYNIIQNLVNFNLEMPCDVYRDFFKKKVIYGYPSKLPVSRLYPQTYSIPHLSRQLRYILFKDVYTDVDLANAHPTILYDFALNNNIDCPLLHFYVNDRQEFINRLSEKSEIDKSMVKKII